MPITCRLKTRAGHGAISAGNGIGGWALRVRCTAAPATSEGREIGESETVPGLITQVAETSPICGGMAGSACAARTLSKTSRPRSSVSLCQTGSNGGRTGRPALGPLKSCKTISTFILGSLVSTLAAILVRCVLLRVGRPFVVRRKVSCPSETSMARHLTSPEAASTFEVRWSDGGRSERKSRPFLCPAMEIARRETSTPFSCLVLVCPTALTEGGRSIVQKDRLHLAHVLFSYAGLARTRLSKKAEATISITTASGVVRPTKLVVIEIRSGRGRSEVLGGICESVNASPVISGKMQVGRAIKDEPLGHLGGLMVLRRLMKEITFTKGFILVR